MEKINCVLLIDDDETTNLLSRHIISSLNFTRQIKICYNGLEAVDFLAKYKEENHGLCPELILVDITMPYLDGFEFLEAFHQIEFCNKDKSIQVILTASTNLKYIRKAKKMGVQDYLIKPLTKANLMELLKNNKIPV
ncbi:MAG: response regulator [Cytophagaceae bacterium]|nr:response regulator [Cytophagaceae bacterium]